MGGIQTGLTDAQLLASQLKAHELVNLNSSASEIDASVKMHEQVVNFIYNLNHPNRNMSMLFVNDSTGDSNTEWIYLTAQYIASHFAINVKFRYWNDTTNAYDSAIIINTGNTYTLDIFNFAVGGTTIHYILGSQKATKAYKEITNTSIYTGINEQLDMLVFNHGHNLDETSMGKTGVALMFAQTVEELITYHPYAGIGIVKQNPNTLLSNETKTRQIIDYANKRGFWVIDFWQKYIELGMDSSLYKDFQHPSDYGQLIITKVVTDILSLSPIYSKACNNTGLMLNKGINYLTNGNFTTYTNINDVPDGYAVSGGTAVKDLTKYDSRKGYSVKFTATATSAYFGIVSLTSGFDHLKGKTVTLAVRMFVDAPTTLETGNIGITSDSTSLIPTPQSKSNGSWVWRFYSLNIKNTESTLRARVYLNNAVGTSVYVDRMILCLGDMPYDAD